MSKRPASSPPLEQQESKKPKTDHSAEAHSSVPMTVIQASQPSDVVEGEGDSADRPSEIILGISNNWLKRPIADYLPEHAYPANGRGDVYSWPLQLLEALLQLSRVTAGQERELRNRLTGAFASAKRYSLSRSLKNIKAVHDSFAKRDDVKSPNGEPAVERDTKGSIGGSKTKKSETKRKAGEGFTPWKPKPAFVDVPDVQPHWGIVPRSGGYRPSESQPSARESDAAVRPPLWENRKGAVRIKRGSRWIGNYDQAYHMWLPLMDMRPISRNNQAPKRKPVGYYYEHGMPTNWNDVGPINDLNKALQEAIKSKSNKEPSFTQIERTALANICAENEEASIWDIAEKFNDQVHPVNKSEEGQYPKGRFIESICHEYLMYKSTYDKGVVPTDATEKEIPLERIFAEKKSSSGKPDKSKKTSSSKVSDTAGTKKERKSKKTTKELDEVESLSPSHGNVQQSADASMTMSEQNRFSEEDESILEGVDAYTMEGLQSSSPMSPAYRAVVGSPSHGSEIAAVEQERQMPVSQKSAGSNELHYLSSSENPVVASTALSGPVGSEQKAKIAGVSHDQGGAEETVLQLQVETETIDAQSATITEIVSRETQIEAAATHGEGAGTSQYATANSLVEGTFVENAVRNTQIDENYSDDDDFDYFL
ncbi:hypothetical protein EKO04_001697 [Ascochyta lentis]|uniref:Uncharacterized protein n=1 Tax=Ascochyta lentis TaxID=205686 RepID=A0A8H7MKN9_9PLEO|nr:hypothetical protein EKO04_001697 [Ascochyta lentis]